ncbi:long-chain-alcohol oxidase FAO1-like [Phragmites australis]|uniref:long-chain-alcohol oxidase FAO1-like n=1 Tax=Phragmites australis TaxID=29695 RepID=UPI002D7A2E4F|nr:long-chain-alcohol oxidase FAO1-like [Phragmites australis]
MHALPHSSQITIHDHTVTQSQELRRCKHPRASVMAGEEAKKATGRRVHGGHPLLRGCEREKYTHGLHPAQMEALRAICGALIPSLPAEGLHAGGGKDLERFYLASAADGTIPDEVAELVTRCVWEALVLVRIVLWILSTKVGTVALCGGLCISGKFPHVCKFADMPVERREQALRRWNMARWLFPLKITFVIIKILCHYAFYTTLNENSDNPSWKAIGYSVPDVAGPPEYGTEAAPSPSPRPLDNGVVETRELNDTALLRSLADKGLAVKPAGASSAHHTVQCDAVIVGSGCGGGVAAAVLASAGHKVVVVEKGDYFAFEDYSAIEGPSMERLYEKGGIFCTSNVTTVLFTGRTVGGGSAVNWSASIRTPEDVTREWALEHGLPVFASPGYVQAMDAVCARLAVTDGCREEGFQNKVVRRGCKALGLHADAVPRNSSEGHFCGSCYLGCPTGDKRGTDTTWLVDAVARGAVILTGCKAEHFVFENSTGGRGRSKKCVGLVATCMSNGITKKLRIEAKVSIAACGALMTPPLLRNSGLQNWHIGRNLHLHPVSMAWGYFPENKQEPQLTGKCYEGGIITSMHRVTARTIIETPALGPGCFASLVPWESGRDMKDRMRRYARTAHVFALVRDRGAGHVDGEGRVLYTPSRDDVDELRNGLRRALRILVAAGAAEVGTHRSDGLRLRCDGVQDDDLEAFLDEVTVEKGPLYLGPDKWALHCSAHQMGSCRMGASPKNSAVDGSGESWEAEGLYVCDGSLLPTAVGVNPMITIQSIAYCLSKGVAETLAQSKKQ